MMDKTVKKLTLKYALTMMVIILLLVGIFYIISRQISSKDILTFDENIISFVQKYISEDVTIWVLRLTDLGSIHFIVPAIIVVSLLLLWRKKYALVIFILSANVFGGILNKSLKWFFKRERPDILPVIMEKGYSFPSGHSMGSLILYGSIAYILIHLVHSRWGKVMSILVAGFLILAIGISRIYLGVHYPTDIVGGYSIGTAFLLLCILAFRYYEQRTGK